MAPKTAKQLIKGALANLSKENFEKFRDELLDREEEPQVNRNQVEDKNSIVVTDVLVSTFTETGAPAVVVELLKQIGCNNDGEKLEKEISGQSLNPGSSDKKEISGQSSNPGDSDNSKTKACVDKGDPTFRKTSTGELETEPSQEARNHVAGQRPFQAAGPGGPPASVKTPEEVEAEAKARVLSEGGDDRNKRLVLSRWTIQFGQYKGQSFKWLLENDVGYTAWWLASHLEQQQDTRGQNSMAVNKDSLERYAVAYPEVLKEVRTLQSAGEALGFGRYKSVTLQKLYESKDEDKISYVNFLRSKSSTCNPGTKMEVAVRYILHRDKNLATNRPTTSFAPRAVRKRQTRKKGVQSTTRQPTRPVRKKPKWS